jgi:hypothetical protein
MAETVQLDPGSVARTAKIRHPIAVAALTLVTIGIYGIYWWYQINREMRDLGLARNATGLGEKPGRSALAMFPGALIIVPPYVSLYNGVKRMQRAQEVAVGSITMNGMIVLGLILGSFLVGVAGLVIPGYIQAELNKVWTAVGSGAAASPPPSAVPAPPPASPAPAPPEG